MFVGLQERGTSNNSLSTASHCTPRLTTPDTPHCAGRVMSQNTPSQHHRYNSYCVPLYYHPEHHIHNAQAHTTPHHLTHHTAPRAQHTLYATTHPHPTATTPNRPHCTSHTTQHPTLTITTHHTPHQATLPQTSSVNYLIPVHLNWFIPEWKQGRLRFRDVPFFCFMGIEYWPNQKSLWTSEKNIYGHTSKIHEYL